MEPDALPGWTFVKLGVGALAVTVALCALAAGLQSRWRAELGGPRAVPPVVRADGTPPSDLFDEAAPERSELPETWTRVDAERVAAPIDRAIELAHPELR
jgi:hypothetical protein